MVEDDIATTAHADSPLRSRMRGIGFHAAGIAVVAAVAFAGLFAGALASFLTSVCNDSPDVVNAHRHALQASLTCIGLGISAAPALWALLARHRGRTALPWAAAAGGVIAATLFVVVSAKPARWCLF